MGIICSANGQRLSQLRNISHVGNEAKDQWRTGGVWGVQPPPPKFRRYRWSPQSREQEEPASQFPFVVHCVLIWL